MCRLPSSRKRQSSGNRTQGWQRGEGPLLWQDPAALCLVPVSGLGLDPSPTQARAVGGGLGPCGQQAPLLGPALLQAGGRRRRANGRLQQGNGACRSISLSWRVGRLPAPLSQPSPADAGGLWFVSRGPGGGAGGRRPCHGGGQGRDGVLSAPTLRCWELRSCGAGGDRALPEAGEGGAEGIGRCPRGVGGGGRGDRVRP